MRSAIIVSLTILISFSFSCSRNPGGTNLKAARQGLKLYRTELDTLRTKTSPSPALPDVKFFQFGMGNRTKLLYKHGILLDAIKGDTIRKWKVKEEIIVPYTYMVHLVTLDDKKITIKEDSNAVWIYSKWKKEMVSGTNTPLKLPDFEENRYPRIMKVLLHEILINIVDSKPLPNFYVYKEPRRRDAAMMALCLELTGNVNLIKNWVLNLDCPFDRNNAGKVEADNLGETLYLISLFNGTKHPLIPKIMDEVKKLEIVNGSDKYISGITNFSEAPVYQTKWLNYGLGKLGLKSEYTIPYMDDNYSALFWWDYQSYYKAGIPDVSNQTDYPYLGWASGHFHRIINGPVSSYDYPLSWERNMSEADYRGMSIINPAFTNTKLATPHSWHAAEMFLYLMGLPKIKFQMVNKYL